ncbi:DUF3768 domain-containing protein [Bradyrhizobium sp. CCBAU 53415]|uniref:DUF3768 domain-containing protein n=1 Tax=Bradyrhizobium sp. CCBAU 53415 TaxID=1325119 RepID=UPI002306D14C|nr:DUF3768 domain-containing protein [Bradyrhizobium sp. CCBAU 53415]
MTPGIAALGSEAVQRLEQTLAIFDDFCIARPAWRTRLWIFEFEGASILFKIDYYDANFEFSSPDPSDPAVTQRVITLMLAEEY